MNYLILKFQKITELLEKIVYILYFIYLKNTK